MVRLFNIKSSIHTDVYVVQEGIKFIREHSLGQVANAVKYMLMRNRNITQVPWDPTYVTIVTESVCTQKCIYCLWHSPFTERPYWPMRLSLADFERILDELKKTKIAHVHLCGTGDPLLNKDIFDMIEYVRKSKMTCSIMTNMNRQVTKNLEHLAKSGINRLNTNLDSGDPKEFEEIRRGAKWETIIGNIKKLSVLRKKYKRRFKIGIYCIAMRSNVHTYKDLMDTCKEIGADDVIFSYLVPVDFVDHPICSKDNVIQETDHELIKSIDEAVAYGRSLGLRVFPPRFPPKGRKRVNCSTMWWKLMINLPNDKLPREDWVGNVSSHCDFSHEGEGYSYGNILKQPFQEVWNGKKLKRFRKRLLTNAPKVCRECPGL